MKKSNTVTKVLLALTAFLFTTSLFAQLTLTGQYRTRSEFRAGQGTYLLFGSVPTFFTNSRLRLNIGYTADRLKFFTSIQDVNTWGQNASTISNMNGSTLSLHEAYAEVQINDSTFLKNIDYLGFKVGRQEIAYDDQKLLGALDWLQQARSHDAIILKFAEKTWKADAGFAFNQSKENKNSGTTYSGIPTAQIGTDGSNIASGAGTNGIGTMYKAMQYLYVSKEIGFTKAAFLLFNDDFQKPGATAGTFQRGVNARTTVGVSVYATILRKHKIDAGFYYQGNKDKIGRTMDGYMATISSQFAVGRKLMTGPGIDFLSGNNTMDSTSKVNRSFDPLYGTPHKFWGYMDYFYASDPYGLQGANGSKNKLSPGLFNAYWKTKYRLRDNLIVTFDVHEFFAANKVANVSTADLSDKMNTRLGTELDFVLNYNLTKTIGFEFGYSVMFGTETMSALKAPVNTAGSNKDLTGQWAYFMINIRPDFINLLNTGMKDMKKSLDDLTKKVSALETVPQN